MSQAYEDALRALVREFVGSVPARLAALHDAAARARAAGDAADATTSRSAAREVGLVAHKLHGVAGSLGFPALGVDAAEAERALFAFADTGDGEQWPRIERALAVLDATARALAESGER